MSKHKNMKMSQKKAFWVLSLLLLSAALLKRDTVKVHA